MRQELTAFKVGGVLPAQWALGALLFAAGQVLNMSVYKALGASVKSYVCIYVYMSVCVCACIGTRIG